MQKFAYTAILILILTFKASPQWRPQNLNTTNTLTSVGFATDSTGWIAGGNGQIFKTTDGGTSWVTQPSGTTHHLSSIKVFDSLNVYISGYGGICLKTTDGGTNWEQLPYSETENIVGTYYFNLLTGWAVGYNGLIQKTTDGGKTWTTNHVGGGIFTSVYFVTDSIGFVAGADGAFYKTTNAGASWINISLNTGDWFFGIDFSTPKNGVVVGGFTGQSQSIYRTTDGGNSWVPQSNPSRNFLCAIKFYDELCAWAVGSEGEVLQTSDGGSNWKRYTVGVTSQLNAVCLTPLNKAFAVGEAGSMIVNHFGAFIPTITITSPISGDKLSAGSVVAVKWNLNFVGHVKIAYSINGGNTWTEIAGSIATETSEYFWKIPNTLSDSCKIKITSVEDTLLSSVNNGLFSIVRDPAIPWLSVISPANGEYFFTRSWISIKWVLNSVQTVKIECSIDGGKNWNTITDSVSADLGQYTWESVKPVSDSCKIRITSTTDSSVYALSTGLFTISPVSANWIALKSHTTQTLTSVAFADSLKGWMIGAGGSISKSTNGGLSWLPQSTGGTEFLSCLAIFDSVNVLVSGYAGVLMGTTNGGTTWGKSSFGTAVDVTSMFFLDKKTGWAVGYSGRVLKTTDGGLTWNSKSITSEILTTVYFLNEKTGFTGGSNGVFFRTDNGGMTWSTVELNNSFVNDWYFGITFSSPLNGILVGGYTGRSQAIFRTTDGGNTWQKKTGPSSKFLCGVAFESLNRGYAVGSLQEILKTVDGGETWIHQDCANGQQFNSISVCPSGVAVAIGMGGAAFTNSPYLIASAYHIILGSPNGGEVWKPGTLHNITWTTTVDHWGTSDTTTKLKIQYTLDDGLHWMSIQDSAYRYLGRYTWVIPNSLSGLCRVKISDYTDLDAYDISEKVFTIDNSTATENAQKPYRYELLQNFPNPFNPTTSISYGLAGKEHVTLKVYTILGNEVTTLVNEEKPAGRYSVAFNAANLSSGIYFYSIRAGNFYEVRKFTLLK